MAERRDDALNGERGEGRGPVGIRERLDHPGAAVEIISVQRFRRGPVEIRIGHEARHEFVMDAAARGERAIGIVGPAEATLHEIVEYGARRTGIEGYDRVAIDIGDIPDAAEVEHHHRLLELLRQGTMIQRCEGSALAAGRNIGVTEAVDRRDAERIGHRLPVHELPGEAAFGTVVDRLAMQADEIDGAEIKPLVVGIAADGGEMIGRDRRLEFRQRFGCGPFRIGDDRLQGAACLVAIGIGGTGAEGEPVAPVARHQRHVDGIHRGAADHADRGQNRGWVRKTIRQSRLLAATAHSPGCGPS